MAETNAGWGGVSQDSEDRFLAGRGPEGVGENGEESRPVIGTGHLHAVLDVGGARDGLAIPVPLDLVRGSAFGIDDEKLATSLSGAEVDAGWPAMEAEPLVFSDDRNSPGIGSEPFAAPAGSAFARSRRDGRWRTTPS